MNRLARIPPEPGLPVTPFKCPSRPFGVARRRELLQQGKLPGVLGKGAATPRRKDSGQQKSKCIRPIEECFVETAPPRQRGSFAFAPRSFAFCLADQRGACLCTSGADRCTRRDCFYRRQSYGCFRKECKQSA